MSNNKQNQDVKESLFLSTDTESNRIKNMPETMNVIENPDGPLCNSPKPADPVESSTENTVITKEDIPSPKSDRSSPDPNCAICLSRLENKSFTDSCFHQFCFTCLLEWSKVKAECPLCKQAFKSIIHNVRSIEDYDQYHLRLEENNTWENQERRRFRYRTTATAERLVLGRLLQQMVAHNDRTRRMRTRYLSNAFTSEFRRQIYFQGKWVQPLQQTGLSRFRDTSPSFYQANPACTHRLVPWLNRELVALLTGNEDRITFVLELILSLIQRYEILSPEFREHIRPFILNRSDHFIHEFYNFARAPWDMRTYDQRANYQTTVRDITSSPDSDVIILSPENTGTRRLPNTSTQNVNTQNAQQTDLPSSESQSNQTNTALERVRQFLNSVNRSGWESPNVVSAAWDSPPLEQLTTSTNCPSSIALPPSPQPGPSGLFHSEGAVSNLSDNESSSSNSTAIASTSSWNRTLPSVVSVVKNQKKEEVDSDSDDCVIVGYQKPFKERTPPVIDLVSNSDESSADERKVQAKESGTLKYKRERCSSSRSRSRSNSKSRYSSSYKSSTSYHSSSSERAHFQKHRYKSNSRSPPCWHWTAYSDGGGKLQRSYSISKEGQTNRLRSLVVVDPNNSSLDNLKKKSSKHKHKKHKKHKHRHKSIKHESEQKYKKHDRGHKNKKGT